MIGTHPTVTATRSVSIVTLLAAAAGGLLLAFGPLNPPAGPVAPSNKTLVEIEPRIAINATNTPGDANSVFKVTTPGSYYLTTNVTGQVGKHGIEIAVGGVTIDLNGFDLAGVAAMGAFDGVSVTAAGLSNIAVINGSTRNWGGEGIDLSTFTAINCRVEGVRASNNGLGGIAVGFGSTITNCTANTNTGTGISAANGGTVTRCASYQNTGTGILVQDGGLVADCSGYQNGINGIFGQSSCTVSHCGASQNLQNGISVGARSSVLDCDAAINTLDGVACFSNCFVRGNNCAFNGNLGDGAGVHASGADNRIEGNNCTGADRGIDVDVAGNVITHNTCSGNTVNWVIAANNYYGPIIDRTGVAAAAVNGAAAASTLATTDPHANFSY